MADNGFRLMDLFPYAILAGVGYVAWQWWQGFKETGCWPFDVACLAGKAGEEAGKGISYVYNVFTDKWTTTTAILEDPFVASERESEHSYIVNAEDCDPTDYSGGPNACVKFGSSGGQSPEQFCGMDPTNPFCAEYHIEVPWFLSEEFWHTPLIKTWFPEWFT